MRKPIKKRTLTSILNLEVSGIKYKDENKEVILYKTINSFGVKFNEEISVNDLFFKAKEWAKDLDYEINSGYRIKFGGFSKVGWRWNDGTVKCFKETKLGLTEQETVFRACQWIHKVLLEKEMIDIERERIEL